MITPILWLKDYINIKGTIKEFASAMTLAGTMAESVSWPATGLSGAVTAKVSEISRHPDSDHLWVCKVFDGETDSQVISGAQNISKGDIVAYGKPGAMLPGRGEALGIAALRGVESSGMLLSAQEMGISASRVPKNLSEGIYVFPQNTPLGIDAAQALGMSEAIIDFELTNNRQDCNSILGIAKEAAACQGFRFEFPDYEYSSDGDEINKYLKVRVEDTSLCKRYTARMVKVREVKPSPLWMQIRLMAAGIRPISNIVDVSNFVMVETGQPLHMFDYSQIRDGEIIVRRASGKDSITTLDGVERELNSSILMIDDADRHIGVAGIMGGLNSEISETTKLVVIEAANFEKNSIRQSSKSIGVHSESASRFEKGVSAWLTRYACDRAASLLVAIEAADYIDGIIDANESIIESTKLEVSYGFVNKLLGTDIGKEEMGRCLGLLGFNVSLGEFDMQVESPVTRSDIRIKEDVAEEIARIFGYDKIPSSKTVGGAAEPPNTRFRAMEEIKKAMIAIGGNEMLTYTFLSPQAHEGLRLSGERETPIRVRNPLGEDSSIMRTSMLHGLLDSLSLNSRKKNASCLLFEVGPIFLKGENQLPTQRNMLVFGSYSQSYPYIKSIADYILGYAKCSAVKFKRSNEHALHPQRGADIFVNEARIGYIGEAHPSILMKYGLSGPVCIGELDCEFLAESINEVVLKARPVAKYPSVRRDLALVCPDESFASDIRDVIFSNGGEFIQECEIFDVYKSESLGDKKSIAFSLTFQSAERTLKEEEVSAAIDNILRVVADEFSAVLRE